MLRSWTADLFWLAVGGAVGTIVGARLKGKPRERRMQSGADPHLLPDPSLRWLQRAYSARGVWVSEAASAGQGEAVWQRISGNLSDADREIIERRLAQARNQAGSGAERLESGTLLFGTASGNTAGILLPADTPRAMLSEASDDLVRLLDGLGRRPLLAKLNRESEPVLESVGSIGLRLAYQLERILGAEVIVAANQKGKVRVIGVSGRADRRLMEVAAAPGSPLEQVARGEIPSLSSIADPLGGIVQDRRTRLTPAIVMPIKSGDDPVGAVAFWTDDDGDPVGPVIAEVHEAMRNAGPRLAAALQLEELNEQAIVDPLTGLRNRRGLEETMNRLGTAQGSLVYCDLDKFKLLNDTLGHPAGDAALVHFARVVHDLIRGGDLAARIGGEEFAIWLPGATLALGIRVADRIRIKLGTTTWDWQGRTWPLSASFGVAAVPETTRSVQNLAGQADAALLTAKREGRNRVEAARKLEAV